MNDKDRIVPIPSEGIMPERDIGKPPVLEARHLGIDFGGLTAVDSGQNGDRGADRSQRSGKDDDIQSAD